MNEPHPPAIDTVFLDAGGVLVHPNWTRVAAALGRRGIEVWARGIERIRQKCRVTPQLLAVAPPDQADLPARQRLSRIPLALAALHQPARCKAIR